MHRRLVSTPSVVRQPAISPAPSLRKPRAWDSKPTFSFPLISSPPRSSIPRSTVRRWFVLRATTTTSTGNLANAVAAQAARLGLKTYILVPSDLEPAKILNTQVYGATLVRVE